MAFITVRNGASFKDFINDNCCVSALKRDSVEYEVKWHTGKLDSTYSSLP